MNAKVTYDSPYRTFRYELPITFTSAEFYFTENYIDPSEEVTLSVMTDDSWAMWKMRPNDFASFVEQLAIDAGVMQYPIDEGY